MIEDIKKVLITEEELKKRVKELGKTITQDYQGKKLVLIGVLKGGVVFLADLIREIDLPLDIDFISVSSYGDSTRSSGIVRIIKDIDIDIMGKHVLIVEDLVDSGLTLRYIKDLFVARDPKSVKCCTALDKPSTREVEIEIEYKGTIIPDEFVVGYGLDFAGKYRNLPDVCILKPHVYYE
ncbi:hypoxanthine phosphoribosyltransferase [Herbivorax sp. ANBcel31]|uniref:hypoxanthine phosphoribosyltransferase n=1 Tax=Herbivorax sp. ANBcel31 TaxID=3069754 RepID=UPI0027B00160|nr:hypoxanthine phosphoribosyltransferase [Herbivorax sp. ANBcel31]MDQ2085114.1 hypoxanthine phosphoribosyltransferase [Herbivorax sp. ANBcel31]